MCHKLHPSDFSCANKILSKESLCGEASFGHTKVSNLARFHLKDYLLYFAGHFLGLEVFQF